MKKFEIAVEAPYETTREALAASAVFIKRSQVDDVFLENGRGDVARLRRQDTVTRLSCTRPLDLACETIVLDFQACQRLLAGFGFKEAARERFLRETWKKHHYVLHLDRHESSPARLTLEAEAWHENEIRMKRQAVKFLKSLGIACKIRLRPPDIDKPGGVPYTAPILRNT